MREWYRRTRKNYRNNATRRVYEMVKYHTDTAYRMRKQARNAVTGRIARGTMTPEPCSLCGSSWGVCAHHNDYTRPLDVTWLCSEHHDMVHGPLPGV
jgi:hypothetical protein